MKKIAGYIRVSRMKNDDAVSPDNQKEKIILQSRLLGFPEDNIDFYMDLDYSGKNTERPDFTRMMENLDKYSHIVVYKLSRFSRSVVDFHSSMIRLDSYNVSLISVSENIDTSTPVGRLIRNILVDFSQFEREIIAEQVRDNMHKNASFGNWNGGNIPYGFDWVDKQLVANDKMEHIRYIFESVANGYGAPTIRNHFYQNRINSPLGKGKWSKNTIVNIIRNPIYRGLYKYGGQVHEGKHEQYISDELFDKANAMLEKRSEKAPKALGSDHLLSSLVVCPHCGRNLNIRYNGRSHNLVRRYVCPGRNDYSPGQKCDCLVIDADSIETAVVNAVIHLADDPEIIEQSIVEYQKLISADIPNMEDPRNKLEAQLKDVKRNQEEMFKLFRKKIITEDQLQEQNCSLLEEETRIKDELAEIKKLTRANDMVDENLRVSHQILTNIKSLWSQATNQEKRELINVIVKSVSLTEDGAEIDCFYFKRNIYSKVRTKTTMVF
jgi:site-specific DNA recombinase